MRTIAATGFTKNNIDWNLKYSCERADISFDQVSSISYYIVNTDSSILRLEFLTETLRNKFFTYAKANRLEWAFNQKKFKNKLEADVNSSDKLARQPFYTLLEFSGGSFQKKNKDPEDNSKVISTHCRFGLAEKPQPSPCWLRLAIHWT